MLLHTGLLYVRVQEIVEEAIKETAAHPDNVQTIQWHTKARLKQVWKEHTLGMFRDKPT